MSWEGYITNITQSGEVEKAAIFGTQEISLWASTPGIQVTNDEVRYIIHGDTSTFACGGVKLEQQKFMMVRNELSSEDLPHLLLQKGKIPATVGKTKTAFIIGIGKENTPAGNVTNIILKYTKYLRECNM